MDYRRFMNASVTFNLCICCNLCVPLQFDLIFSFFQFTNSMFYSFSPLLDFFFGQLFNSKYFIQENFVSFISIKMAYRTGLHQPLPTTRILSFFAIIMLHNDDSNNDCNVDDD